MQSFNEEQALLSDHQIEAALEYLIQRYAHLEIRQIPVRGYAINNRHPQTEAIDNEFGWTDAQYVHWDEIDE